MSPTTSKTCTKVSSEQVANKDLVGWQKIELMHLEWADNSQTTWPLGVINFTKPFANPATKRLSPLFNNCKAVTGISLAG